MSNRFSSFLKKTLFGKGKNLASFDDPYQIMAGLLKDIEVTGIIDAGASSGRISKKLLLKFPKAHVYGFEPNSFYSETLQQYSKKESRFHPQFLALSDHEGTSDLHITQSPGNTSLFFPGTLLEKFDPRGASVKSSVEVEVVTIDQWAKRNKDPAIQLMKFDIQSGELQALQGAVRVLQNTTALVYTEIWFNPLYKDGALFSEIDLFLRKNDFVMYDIFKPKYDPTGLLLWGNAIYLHPGRLGV
jgi:FkbM family methyltransferase